MTIGSMVAISDNWEIIPAEPKVLTIKGRMKKGSNRQPRGKRPPPPNLPNVHLMASKKKKESDDRKAINEVMGIMVESIELMQIKAKLCREYYNSLIKEGFSDIEALELCRYFTVQV